VKSTASRKENREETEEGRERGGRERKEEDEKKDGENIYLAETGGEGGKRQERVNLLCRF